MTDPEWLALADDMDRAADILELLSAAVYGDTDPAKAEWSARQLRTEAIYVRIQGAPK